MSSLLGNNILVGASEAGKPPYVIENSVRGDGTGYLERTPSGDGNRRTWTFSAWVKISGNDESMFGTPFAYPYMQWKFDAGSIEWMEYTGSYTFRLVTTQVFRDPSAWYHFVASVDTTQATASNRLKMYVNGEQITDFSTETYPTQDTELSWNKSGEAQRVLTGNTDPFEGYMAEVYSIDGTALTPASFAETDSKTNQWVPKKYAGSYGTNGFFLKFADSSALGTDSSGNGNTFTVTNLVATDQMIDTPTNNFCTINPLAVYPGAGTFSEGNLKFAGQTGQSGADRNTRWDSTMSVDSGKWYFEALAGVSSDSTQSWVFGIRELGFSMRRQGWGSGTWTAATDGYMYGVQDGDQKQEGGSTSSFTNGIVTGDVVSLLLDLDSSPTTLKCWVNGSDKGTLFSSLSAKSYGPAGVCWQSSNASTVVLNTGSDSSFAGNKTAQGNQDSNGKGDFYYEPPSGFLALCSKNLPDPEIKLPQEHFGTSTWSALSDGSAQSISQNSFQPDLVWIKQRNGTYDHMLFDSVRGATKYLEPNDNAIEATDAQTLTSFDSDGFSLGTASTVNGPNDSNSYVGWAWKAGGTAATNDDGTEDTSVSANTTAGMSVVKFTGTGSASDTFGHGLSQAPDLIILKNYDGSSNHNWSTWHEALGAQSVIYLDGTGAADIGTSSGRFSTLPTSSVFTAGSDTNVNENTVNFIGFCFHSVEGYSKVGSYEGNGNADGTFIYTGFKPEYFLTKNIDQTESWAVWDGTREPYNKLSKKLSPDSNVAEYTANTTTYAIDFVSNGVKLRSSYSVLNSAHTFIYIAFAESPFKYSNAR